MVTSIRTDRGTATRLNRLSGIGIGTRVAFVAALLICVSASVALLPLRAGAEEPLRLGILPSATGPGASIGAALVTGVELAVSEINKNGGVLGRQITIIRGDTQSNPTTATTEAKRLAEREKIELLIGPLVSQEVVPTVAVMTEAKVVQITNAGTAALNPQNGPYHFSSNASSETVSEVMVRFIAEHMKDATVGILADDGGQSRTGVAALKQNLQKRGIPVTIEQEYRNRADDLTPQILSLKRANPGVVLVFLSFVEDGVKMLNTFRDVGWQPKIVGSTAISVYAPAIARRVEASTFDDVYSAAYRGMTYCTGDPAGAGAYATFQEKLKTFAPNSVGKISMSLASEYYDAVTLLTAAVKAVGSTNAVDVAHWIETEGSNVPLIHGAVSPSAQSHFLFGPSELVVVERPNRTSSDGLMKRSGC
jgi:branched-chain amino acid transport system substrate-binding protein